MRVWVVVVVGPGACVGIDVDLSIVGMDGMAKSTIAYISSSHCSALDMTLIVRAISGDAVPDARVSSFNRI